MANPFERQENPEVKELFSALYHHLSHFFVLSNAGDKYNVTHLEKSKEFIDKILQVSQNESLISVLQEMKGIFSSIDINSKYDTALVNHVSKLTDTANIEQKY